MTTPSETRVGSGAQVLATMRLASQQLVRSRRTVAFALLGLLPPVLGVLFAVVRQIPQLHVNATGWDMFGLIMGTFYLQFFLIFLALFYGTALINSEVEDRTLTYLLARPVPRRLLVLGKYLTYALVVVTLLLPSVALTYVVLEASDGLRGIVRHLPVLAWDMATLLVGALAYGALFAFLGTALKRPVMVGLFFTVIWEWAATYVPGKFARLTVLHYLLSLYPHSSVQRGIQALFSTPTSRPVALLVLLGITAGFLWATMEVFRRREYVLEQ